MSSGLVDGANPAKAAQAFAAGGAGRAGLLEAAAGHRAILALARLRVAEA